MCGMMSMDVHDMIRHYLPENPATKRLSGKKQTQGGPLPLINGVITPINGRKWVTIGWFHPIWSHFIYIYNRVYFTPFATAFWAHLAPHPKKNLSSLRLIDFSPNLRVRIFRDDGKSGSRRVETKNTESRGSVIFCWSEPVLECNTNLKWPKCNDKDRLELNVVYLSPKSLKFTLWISFRRSIFNFSLFT